MRVFLDCRTEPRRSTRSSSQAACRAVPSVIAQALDRRKRPRRPLVLSCLKVLLTAAADTMEMYAASPCVDARPRRDGAAVDEARVQRHGRELQSDLHVLFCQTEPLPSQAIPFQGLEESLQL